MEIQKTSPLARVPTRAYNNSVGWDLYACEGAFLQPFVPTKIKTGIAVKLPENCFGLLKGRSSFHLANILTLTGVIDPDYRGEILCVLTNIGHRPLTIREGRKIAQLLILPAIAPTITVVDSLDQTLRGDGGFGSSEACEGPTN